MRNKLATVLVGTSSLLTACGEQAPEILPGVEARVYNHFYDDPDVISIKPLIIDPEAYYLDVEQCGHVEQKTVENKLGCVAIRVKVSESTYLNYPDGSKIIFEDN